jgi:hypothetical protein
MPAMPSRATVHVRRPSSGAGPGTAASSFRIVTWPTWSGASAAPTAFFRLTKNVSSASTSTSPKTFTHTGSTSSPGSNFSVVNRYW